MAQMSLTQLETIAPTRKNDSRFLYYYGKRLNEKKRFAEADPVLRQAVGLEPNSARLRDQWTQALLGNGLTTAAFGQIKQFIEANPDSAEAHRIFGKFYVTQNSLNRAIEELDRSTRLDPSDAETYYYLAFAHNALRHYQPALEAATQAAEREPANVPYRLLQAAAMIRASAPANDIQRTFQMAIKASLGLTIEAAARREYARFLLQQPDLTPETAARAENEARKSLAIDARDPGSRTLLGKALVRQGRSAEAIEPLRVAVKALPFDPSPALTLTQALRAAGQSDAAAERDYLNRQQRAARKRDLFAAIEKTPDAAEPRRQMARLLAEEGDAEGCLRHHAKARHLAPDAPLALVAAANDLTETGNADAAILMAQQAVTVSQNSPLTHEALGNALLAAGKPRDAAAEYDKAAGWLPEKFAVYQKKLADYYAARRPAALSPAETAYQAAKILMRPNVGPQRATPEAEAKAQEAVTLDPANPIYLRLLLSLQMQRKRNAEATATAQKLTQIAPDDAKAHAILALLLASAGGEKNLGEAERQLKRAQTPESANDATYCYAAGVIALERKNPALAVQQLRRAVELDPDANIAYYKLSRAQTQAGNPKAATDAMNIYRRRENEKRAEADALREIVEQPQNAALYERAASVLDAHGKREQAAAVRAAEARIQPPSSVK